MSDHAYCPRMIGAAKGGAARCLRHLLFAAVSIAGAACGGDEPDPNAPRTFEFGPFSLAPGQEDTNLCVSVTLDNPEPMFVSAVELATGNGFHHSNWFHVPHETFRGEDGVWPCDSRAFNEPVAAGFGGVLFAQSTQATHEVQAFPAGAAIPIPPYSKIVAGLHLLNGSDTTLDVPLSLTVTPIPREAVTVQLRPLGLENKALALPPHRRSAFAMTCDLAPKHNMQLGRDPDFRIHYVLPHYHGLGTGMRLEAIDAAGNARTVFDNEQRVGAGLGGPIDPTFDMTGATALRLTCLYENPRDTAVGFGAGDQEMCVLLGFTDSPNQWGGAVLDPNDPGEGVDEGTLVTFQKGCDVYTLPKDDL